MFTIKDKTILIDDRELLNQLDKFNNENNGFNTKETAIEYGQLRKKFHSNLVLLGVKEDSNGRWHQYFNVFD